MTNKKMWDNSNMQEDIEWGNIELPGVPDKVLLTKNWAKSEATKLKHKNPDWREKYLETREKLKNDEWAEKHRKITLDLLKDPSHLEKLRKANKEKVKTKEWRKSQQRAGETRKNDPTFKEKIKQGMMKESYQKSHKEKSERQKKCYKSPHGYFGSKSEIANFYSVDNAMIGYWLKSKPNDFYEISKEEYEKVKHIPLRTFKEIPHPSRKKNKQLK